MRRRRPRLVVLAGPNGAGKSTVAARVLRGALGVQEFVNADTIAHGLSGFQPARVGMEAGRVMLRRLRTLASQRVDFAYETTLASRSFAPWISQICAQGCEFHLIFLWLPSPALAVARVRERVRLGGHAVPEATIRRRHLSGVKNLFSLYLPLTTSWRFYDNSGAAAPTLIAMGTGTRVVTIRDKRRWKLARAQAAR